MGHGKFIQISTVVANNGNIVIYALDENGKVWEKIASDQGGTWTLITL